MVLIHERETASGRRHIRELDGIRGLLAFGVILLHFGINGMIQRLTGWPGMTLSLAVDVFFLLSGYVLALSYDGDAYRFAIKRIWRLAPVYFLTLALIMLTGVGREVSLTELIMAPPLFGLEPANFPAWSITWELYLPIAGVQLLRLWQPPWRLLLLVAMALQCLAASRVPLGEVLGGVRAAAGLIAGACLTRLRPIPLPTWPVVGGLLLLMLLAQQWHWFAALVPPLTAIAILAGASRESLFSARPFQFAGAISYTAYMVHAPVLFALGERAAGSVAWKMAGLTITVAAAWAMTRWVEIPALKLCRNLLDKTSTRAGRPVSPP